MRTCAFTSINTNVLSPNTNGTGRCVLQGHGSRNCSFIVYCSLLSLVKHYARSADDQARESKLSPLLLVRYSKTADVDDREIG